MTDVIFNAIATLELYEEGELGEDAIYNALDEVLEEGSLELDDRNFWLAVKAKENYENGQNDEDAIYYALDDLLYRFR